MLLSVADLLLRGVQLADRQPHERPGELDHDAGIGRQIALADDAADRALAADQNGFDVAAVLAGDEVGNETRTTGEMHDLDVVAGAVEHVAGIGVDLGQMRRDQREVGGVEAAQQIVERPLTGRRVASRLHPENPSVPGRDNKAALPRFYVH